MQQKPAPALYDYRKRTVLFFFHIYLQVPEPVYPVFFKVVLEYLFPHIRTKMPAVPTHKTMMSTR